MLVALCRPYKEPGRFAKPASNRQIADELVLSVDAVKTHMRALFRKFAVEDLPQNRRRIRLAEFAFESGRVGEHEL